jgi:pimeloyl-ACP methyl ester carboxylesterase
VAGTARRMRPFRAADVELEGRRLEVRDLPGDDQLPPLVLLHEGLGSVGLWRAFPQRLRRATGRRVIAYSRHGHGSSEPPPAPRTPAFFEHEAGQILPALLAQLKIARPVLVGHSDGASIALLHAAAHPVRALVLIAPHVFVEETGLEAIRETRERFDHGDLRGRMAKHHADPDAAFDGWADVWLDPAFRGWSIESQIGNVTVPTLLIQGAEDPYGTPEQLDRIEARIPATRLLLPGGHSPHLKHTGRVVRAVADFLAGLG